MSSSIGPKLRQAREEAGLSQGAFARSVGLSSEYISLLESGKRVPSFDTLIRIASYLGKEPAFFLSEKVVTFRSLLEGDSIPSGLKRQLSRFRVYCESYLEAEKATGRFIELAPLYKSISAERMAEEERRRLGLGDEPIRDLFSLVEMNGLCLFKEPLPDEARVAGIFVFDVDTARAFALLNSREPAGLQLVAAAHLYGHYLHDRDAGLIVDSVDVVVDEYVSLYPPREQFAQAFASRFLVPPSKLKIIVEKDAGSRGLSYDQVLFMKRYFGVSTRTVLRALRRDNLIGGSRFEEYFRRDAEGREEEIFGNTSGYEEKARLLKLKKTRAVASDRFKLLEAERVQLARQKSRDREEENQPG